MSSFLLYPIYKFFLIFFLFFLTLLSLSQFSCVLNTVFLSIQCFLFWHWGAFSLHTHTHTWNNSSNNNKWTTHTHTQNNIFCIHIYILYQCQDFCSNGNFIYLRHHFIVSTTKPSKYFLFGIPDWIWKQAHRIGKIYRYCRRKKRKEIYLFANITAPENGNKTRESEMEQDKSEWDREKGPIFVWNIKISSLFCLLCIIG